MSAIYARRNLDPPLTKSWIRYWIINGYGVQNCWRIFQWWFSKERKLLCYKALTADNHLPVIENSVLRFQWRWRKWTFVKSTCNKKPLWDRQVLFAIQNICTMAQLYWIKPAIGFYLFPILKINCDGSEITLNIFLLAWQVDLSKHLQRDCWSFMKQNQLIIDI